MDRSDEMSSSTVLRKTLQKRPHLWWVSRLSKFQSPKRGAKESFFFSGLTNDWNLGRCTNNTRGNGKQQEEEGEETETEETGQDFHFFETFFLTSKHELLTCFGHLRCCKLRKVPLPHLGFNLVSFFNGTFLTKKGDTHGVTHFFPGWNI